MVVMKLEFHVQRKAVVDDDYIAHMRADQKFIYV